MLIISHVGGTKNRPILKPIEFTQIKIINVSVKLEEEIYIILRDLALLQTFHFEGLTRKDLLQFNTGNSVKLHKKNSHL